MFCKATCVLHGAASSQLHLCACVSCEPKNENLEVGFCILICKSQNVFSEAVTVRGGLRQ